jgi:hypothetical protein
LTGRPMWRSRLRCWAGLSDWSNRISVAPVCSASALISSALPPQGARRRDRVHAGGLGQQAEFFQLRVEVGQPKVHPDQQGRDVRMW